MIATRRLLLAAAGAALIAPPALAHRSQSVLTTVEWNDQTKALEVIHRIHAHDAEVGLMEATGATGNMDITQVENQARLLLYIEKHFAMSDKAGKIALQPVGAELQAEAILVYQEAKRPAPPPELTVTNSILCDVFEQQTNLVNIKLVKKTRTLLFTEGSGAKRADGLL